MVPSSTARRHDDPGFVERLAAARSYTPPAVDPATLEDMIKSVVTSLAGDVSLADLQLYREVETLADYIQTVRRDIAGLRPDDISTQHIPMATDELDAVVLGTADATGVILGAMEDIERLAGDLPPALADQVGPLVIKVYEACGFQDITGQRITKVVKALRHIETRIDALLAVFGSDFAAVASSPGLATLDASDSLLNGPSLPSAAANNQADIDALMGFD
jgi:chemotaxis protein CheZ